MKRIVALLAALMLIPTAANAAVYTFDCNTNEKYGAVAAFDSKGVLTAIKLTNLNPEGGKLITDDINIVGNTVKLFFPGSDTAVKGSIKEAQPTSPPDNSDLYPEEHLSLYAPALVKKVQPTYIDDEDVCLLTLLYSGEEIEFSANSELLIESAAHAYEDMIGQNASALTPGDVIILNYVFKDYPKSICLLHRPCEAEPLFDNELTDFSPLYTNGALWSTDLKDEISHRYGIVTDITDNAIAIADKDGKPEYIPLHKNSAVYSFNSTEEIKAELSDKGAIFECYIEKGAADEDGNITDWSKTADRCYVLLRAIDGVATDIIIYSY